MSERLDALLRAEMARWEAAGLRREVDQQLSVRVAREREFASNDYLSLARDPRIVEAARDAIARHGVGGRAARLLGGGCELDRAAERACAEWLEAEDALLFPSGWQANAGVLGALCERGDAIVSDALNHASIVDAARATRARVLVFAHRDVEALERCLIDARGARRRVVVVESVFSMDGDLAPLALIHQACVRHDALLVVDEAHATGLVGPRGAGGWAAADADDSHLAARIVTGGKALGASGAFAVGGRALREHLANRARSFVFTTAVSPAVSGALVAAIEIARTERDARERATRTARTIAEQLELPEPAAAVALVHVGSIERALELAAQARERGLDVRAVRPPTVPEGSACLRISCHAHNDERAITDLVGVLTAEHPAPRAAPFYVRPLARAVFVVGTDTDVGKTVVSALCVRALAHHGSVGYWKPIQTGSASDTDEVRRLVRGVSAARFEPAYSFSLAASPHAAAADAGATIDAATLSSQLRGHRSHMTHGALVVELAGGLLVPLDAEYTQADWLARERPQIVLVARAGLGTLNHTLLTLEALRARALEPRVLLLVGNRHATNAAMLRARSGIAHVVEVPRFDPLEPAALDGWLCAHDIAALLDAP